MKPPALLLTFFLSFALFTPAFSQKNKEKKLKGDEAKAVLDQLSFDTTVFLRTAGKNACTCIDSVDKAEDNTKKIIEGISGCIDKQVSAYEMALQLVDVLKSSKSNHEISISSKGSDEYNRSYYRIERWLKDSCAEMNTAINTHNEASQKSFSKNGEAMEAYNKGVPLLQAEKYADCIPWFEKAVKIDPEFVFAWDNLGICYRRINNFEKAEAAYKTSLSIEPSGKTALQNLPIVYLKQNKNTEAISAYTDILKHYPGDPEVYYGIAIVYFENKKDMELALDYMCKAYNLYIKEKSPFRSDAEKVINMIYSQMKKENKEEAFNRILKENNINAN